MNALNFYLGLSALIFAIGTLGVLIRRNVIVMLMCVELMLNAVNISFVALSHNFGSADGQVYVFFVMTVAAAEVAVGLAIVIAVFRNYSSVEVNEVDTLKG